MKAIEKDRARRYGTPSELASDVRRYLRPRAGTGASRKRWLSRCGKYVRRHRVGVTVGGQAWRCCWRDSRSRSSLQAQRITRERDRANRITDFMAGMFKVSDPNEARGNSVTAREILDKASNGIRTAWPKIPKYSRS